MNEETVMTYPEARATKKKLFPEYDIDYLFMSERRKERS